MKTTSLLCVMLLACLLPQSAKAYQWQDPVSLVNYYYESGSDKASVKGNFSSSGSPDATGDIVIPETIEIYGKTYTVTKVGNRAFYKNSITSIKLPSTVEEIGESAFEKCEQLKEVVLPAKTKEVSSYASYAFRDCKSLESINIPEGVASIGYCCFYGCSSLKSVFIPSTLNSAGTLAFSNCLSLESVHISDIDAWCEIDFGGGGSPLECAHHLYLNGGEVTEVSFPSGISKIKDYVLSGANSITKVSLPDGIATIGYYAFANCNSLTEISIPANVDTIYSMAFSRCSSLKSIVLHDNIKKIDYGVFAGCSSLSSINLPNKLTEISGSLFSDCSSLSEIKLPEELTNIGDYAFDGCSSLISVTIPGCVNSIGKGAFKECSSISEVAWPENINKIQSETFYGCSNLECVTFPASLKTIEYEAFSGCDNLQKVCISDLAAWCSVSIDGPLFKEKTYLLLNGEEIRDLIVPEGVTAIAAGPFQGLKTLNSVYIPEGVESISSYAFMGCTNLTSISLPASLNTIGTGAFSGCAENLSSIKVAEGNSNYDSRRNCNALIETATGTLLLGSSNTVIPQGISTIGYQAFYNCSGLKSINLPNTIWKFDGGTFSGCTGLTTINSYMAAPPTITYWEFSGCYNATLYVPKGTKDAYKSTSGWSNFSNIVETDKEPEPLFNDGDYFTVKTKEGVEMSFQVISVAANTCRVKGRNDEGNNNTLSAVDKSTEGTVTIPDSPYGFYVVEIGWGAFNGCGEITKITVPSSVEFIGSFAFNHCENLSSVNIPDDVYSIGEWAFADCGKLRGISLPSKISKIQHSTFYGSGLYSIDIPENVTVIYDQAFWFCERLMSVTIRSRGCGIGHIAFADCKGLDEITVYMNTPPEIEEETFIQDYNNGGNTKTYENATLYVPLGTANLYRSAQGWEKFHHIIEMTDIPTTLKDMITEKNPDCKLIYGINGSRRESLKKGINIMQMNDGTTRKVIVK